MNNLLLGLNVPPWAVGAARAIVLAVLLAAIGEAQHQAGILDWGQFAFAAPIILGLLRTAEGFFDQMNAPAQNAVPSVFPVPLPPAPPVT